MRHIVFSTAAAVVACASLAACAGDSTGPAATRAVSVSFTSRASSATSASLSSAPQSVTVGTDVLLVQSVELVLSRVELQSVGGTCASEAAAGDDDAHADDRSCAELELAPSVVTVPVNGGVAGALTVNVPAGSYSSLEAKIRPVDTKSGGERRAGSAAFLSAHPDLAGVSVRVRGTFNGSTFTYVGAPQAQLETAFSPALVIDAAGASTNLTVNVDLTSWFRNSSGTLVDPSTANAGGANASLVAENVKRSFRAFRDDDRDGQDDGPGHR
jgi:hypothetical protein